MTDFRMKYQVSEAEGAEDLITATYAIETQDWLSSRKYMISNLELFEYYADITTDTATEILEYYANLLVSARIKGIELSTFRTKLLDFINGKILPVTTRYKLFDNHPVDTNYTGIPNLRTVVELAGFCKYLVHQYTIDRTVEDMYERHSWQLPDIRNKISEINCALNDNENDQDLSPFIKYNDEKIDTGLADARTVYVKAETRFVYRGMTKYFCYSDMGAIELDIQKASPFRMLASKAFFDGCNVKLGPGKLTTNISQDTAVYIPVIWEFFTD